MPILQSVASAFSGAKTMTNTAANNGNVAGVPAVKVFEFIPNQVYLTALSGTPVKSENVHYFTVDQELAYMRFFNDFGPNNLGQVFRFIAILNNKLQNPELANKKIVLYSSTAPDKRSNAAYLLCMYMMLVHQLSPEAACKPIEELIPTLIPYRDAGYGANTYQINILDCCRGLHRAIRKGICKLDEFNLQEYEFYEQIHNGDMNWVLPNKFLAFATPHDETSPDYGSHNVPYRAPRTRIEDTIAYFKRSGVTTVVRLNDKTYDRQKFLDAGIQHIEMFFPDGSCPPENILLDFIDLAERTPGKIAVHCKAGLGRTGTLIAAYIMKHYHFTASEVISWLRIVRPGSVVGPQQNYLSKNQSRIWSMNLSRQRSGELTTGAAKLANHTKIETVFVEPTDALATSTMVDGLEYSVPIQPRKGENANAYIVASNTLGSDEASDLNNTPRVLRSSTIATNAAKTNKLQNGPQEIIANAK